MKCVTQFVFIVLAAAVPSVAQTTCFNTPGDYPVHPLYGVSEVVTTSFVVESHSWFETLGFWRRWCYNYKIDAFLYENTTIIKTATATSSAFEGTTGIAYTETVETSPAANTPYTVQANHWGIIAFSGADPFGYSNYSPGSGIGRLTVSSASAASASGSHFLGSSWAQDYTDCAYDLPESEESTYSGSQSPWSGVYAAGFNVTVYPVSPSLSGRTVTEEVVTVEDGCHWEASGLDPATDTDIENGSAWTLTSANAYDSEDYTTAEDSWVDYYKAHTENPNLQNGACVLFQGSQTIRINSCNLPGSMVEPPHIIGMSISSQYQSGIFGFRDNAWGEASH